MFSVCTLETLFAKREAGYIRHMYSTYNVWRKEFSFWGHGQEKPVAWLAARFHNHATVLILATQSIALIGVNFIDNEIISVQ